jgi:hypothetical protein
MGARTCSHVRPGRQTILECRFNKTTHHLKEVSKLLRKFELARRMSHGAACVLLAGVEVVAVNDSSSSSVLLHPSEDA